MEEMILMEEQAHLLISEMGKTHREVWNRRSGRERTPEGGESARITKKGSRTGMFGFRQKKGGGGGGKGSRGFHGQPDVEGVHR